MISRTFIYLPFFLVALGGASDKCQMRAEEAGAARLDLAFGRFVVAHHSEITFGAECIPFNIMHILVEGPKKGGMLQIVNSAPPGSGRREYMLLEFLLADMNSVKGTSIPERLRIARRSRRLPEKAALVIAREWVGVLRETTFGNYRDAPDSFPVQYISAFSEGVVMTAVSYTLKYGGAPVRIASMAELLRRYLGGALFFSEEELVTKLQAYTTCSK